MPSEHLSDEEKTPTDEVSMRRKDSIPSHTTEIEEIKNTLVSISTRCQYLENRVAGKKVKYNLISVRVSVVQVESKHKLCSFF